ncbi:MAG: alpha-ketoglutarate-dependent dioxygenase AlkB [Saprospiraceae bacterium]|nr:alpha-ketoglutarate-dependent dioxygenase AlkB [Candidatus Defluviibacterium haderslevense]
MMQDLFGDIKTDNEVTIENAKQIIGLNICFDFISNEEEIKLLSSIDKNKWLSDLKRRVQHYGYKYDYKARRIDQSLFIGDIPNWMVFLCDRLQEKQIISFKPDQAIINEYVGDQGISAHIDCEPCFGDTIISISLGGQCVMNFQREVNTKEQYKIPLLIKPRTLLVMTKESRFNWYHGIPSRKTDKFNDQIHKRQRRVSITFRKVIIDN